jgi:carbamoylphosphate synthase large subunit
MMKNILLIGYDSNICLGVSYCLSKMGNSRLFLLTNNKKNAGKYSRFIKQTYYYEDKTLEIADINNIIKKEKIHLVFPYDENEGIFISSNLKNICTENTRCIWLTDPENYTLGVNKLQLAKRLSTAKINTPIFIQNNNKELLLAELSKWDTPLIMKPLRSSFGRGIMKFTDSYSVEKFLNLNNIDLSQHFFQPYILGSDLTVNTIASKGELLQYTIQETPIKTNPVFVSGDDFEFKEDEAAIELVAKALKELKWNGVACFDLRRNAKTGELFILEINGRFWASLLSAFKKGGVNFPAILTKLSLGEAVQNSPKKYESQISIRNYFYSLLSGRPKQWKMTKYGTYFADPIARFQQLISG